MTRSICCVNVPSGVVGTCCAFTALFAKFNSIFVIGYDEQLCCCHRHQCGSFSEIPWATDHKIKNVFSFSAFQQEASSQEKSEKFGHHAFVELQRLSWARNESCQQNTTALEDITDTSTRFFFWLTGQACFSISSASAGFKGELGNRGSGNSVCSHLPHRPIRLIFTFNVFVTGMQMK